MGRTRAAREVFFRGLERAPIVPAVRGPDEALSAALSGPHAAVFVLGGDVFRVLEAVEKVGRRGRRPAVCVNVDMIGGVSGDASGLRFLAGRVEGIISTHRHVIELAKGLGLVAIQRLFAIDSGAVERGARLVDRADPHCVEILPALALPEVLALCPKLLERPVLAGGLLKRGDEASALLAAGATAVSTSHRGLWRSAGPTGNPR